MSIGDGIITCNDPRHATLTAERDRLREEFARLDALHARIVDIADDILGMQPVVTDRIALLDAIEKAYHRERIARTNTEQHLASLATAARELVAALPHCTAVLDAANTVCGKPGLRRERVDIGFEDRCDEHLEGPYFSNGYSSELKRLLSQLSALDSAGGEGETNSPKNWESSK